MVLVGTTGIRASLSHRFRFVLPTWLRGCCLSRTGLPELCLSDRDMMIPMQRYGLESYLYCTTKASRKDRVSVVVVSMLHAGALFSAVTSVPIEASTLGLSDCTTYWPSPAVYGQKLASHYPLSIMSSKKNWASEPGLLRAVRDPGIQIWQTSRDA